MLTTKQKEEWIQALESGEYKKGIGALQPTADCFCVMGVLLDSWGVCWQNINGDFYALVDSIYCYNKLPYSMLNEAPQVILTRMNDMEGRTFAAMATWIRQNIPTEE